jgi:hypothetical protein
MSNATEKNRLSRTAAKEVPHRSDERFFSAKADVKKACEDLLHDLRHSSMHEPMVADLTTAVNRVQQSLKDIAPDEPKASSQVRDIAKEVQHLQLAETWVSSAERVLGRLGTAAPTKMRDELLEAQDTVMWCVRAEHWDGQLTAAVTQLQKQVQEAEALASRITAG